MGARELAGSLPDLRKAAAIFEALAAAEPGIQHYDNALATTYARIGDVLAAMGQHAKALDEYERAMRFLDRLLATDPDHPGMVREAFELERRRTLTLMSMGDRAGALRAFERLGRRAESCPPATRPYTRALTNLTLAAIYAQSGDCEQARPLAQRSADFFDKLAAQRKAQSPDDLRQAQSLLSSCQGAAAER